MNHKTDKGFTLIELLVVIAIIGVLSSVILASMTSARKKAIDTKILAEYNQIRTAMEIYYNENGSYPKQSVPGTYCIGSTTCILSNIQQSNPLTLSIDFDIFAQNSIQSKNVAYAGTFNYVPSSNYTIGSGSNTQKGFLYVVPSASNSIPGVVFATNKTGVVEGKVGIWTTGVYTSNN